MTNVTLKDIKDLQAEINASLANTQAIRDEQIPWKEKNALLQNGIRHCRREIDELSLDEKQNKKAILDAVARLGQLTTMDSELTADHWKHYGEYKKRYDDSWKKDARLSMKLRKLKRKYWEGHGVQD